MLPFTMEELSAAVADGRVTERGHPDLPMNIYNYSPEVQYTNHWDEVTLSCRGLILDCYGNIVARPWQKFFNLGQVNLPIQFNDPVEVMDKADGSLGILYPNTMNHIAGNAWIPDTFAIATRGSFASEQAKHATEVWNNNYSEYYDDLSEQPYFRDYTLLFEIVYPSNRIVLDYGDMDDLILLGAVEKEKGYYLGPNAAAAMFAWPGPVVEVMPYESISEALSHLDRDNAEGYVIRSHNFLVKCKQPDYLELHRLVTNASPKTVWEQLKAGKSKSEIISAFPDEFHDYIGGMIDPLLEKFETRLSDLTKGYWKTAQDYVTKYGTNVNRADYARLIKNEKDKKYYFLFLDNRSVRDVLWAELRPRESINV